MPALQALFTSRLAGVAQPKLCHRTSGWCTRPTQVFRCQWSQLQADLQCLRTPWSRSCKGQLNSERIRYRVKKSRPDQQSYSQFRRVTLDDLALYLWSTDTNCWTCVSQLWPKLGGILREEDPSCTLPEASLQFPRQRKYLEWRGRLSSLWSHGHQPYKKILSFYAIVNGYQCQYVNSCLLLETDL